MGGRLEHEIRLLPQVISCSFMKDDYVVVLVDPSADLHTIQLTVERILQNAGSSATVRVIGPSEPAAVAATRPSVPFAATAAVATVAVIGVGALVGGLATTEHPAPRSTRPAPVAFGTAAPFDSVDALRGLQFTVQAPAAPVVRLPVEAPDHTLRVLPVSLGTAAEAVSLTKAMPAFGHHRAGVAATSSRQAKGLRSQRRGHKGKHLGHGPHHRSRPALHEPRPRAQRGWDR